MGEIASSVFAPTGEVLSSSWKKVTAWLVVRDCSDFNTPASHIEPRTPQLAMFRKVPTLDLLPGWRIPRPSPAPNQGRGAYFEQIPDLLGCDTFYTNFCVCHLQEIGVCQGPQGKLIPRSDSGVHSR